MKPNAAFGNMMRENQPGGGQGQAIGNPYMDSIKNSGIVGAPLLGLGGAGNISNAINSAPTQNFAPAVKKAMSKGPAQNSQAKVKANPNAAFFRKPNMSAPQPPMNTGVTGGRLQFRPAQPVAPVMSSPSPQVPGGNFRRMMGL